LFLQFLDLYGNPVYVRPERVDALRGIAVTWESKPRAATLIVMTNRETFRVRGHVDAVKDGIDAWLAEHAPKLVVGDLTTFVGCTEVADCRHRPSANPLHQAPEDCPLVKCDTPSLCAISDGRCKTVAAERN